jgi:hypothetical protein
MLAYTARQNDDGNAILLCLVECLLGCLSSIMEYFNKVRRSSRADLDACIVFAVRAEPVLSQLSRFSAMCYIEKWRSGPLFT